MDLVVLAHFELNSSKKKKKTSLSLLTSPGGKDIEDSDVIWFESNTSI